MEGKRRQKGEQLIITKKRVESTSKGGGVSTKYKTKVSQDRNSGGSMTQEKELKLGEVGRRKAQIVQKKESRRGKLM